MDVVIFEGTAPTTFTLPDPEDPDLKGKVIHILNYAKSDTNVDLTMSPAPIVVGQSDPFTNAILKSYPSEYGSNAGHVLGNTIQLGCDGTNWYKLGN
jgi:hypothetical protein